MNTPPSIIFPPAGPPMSPRGDDYLSYDNKNEILRWLLTTATRNSSSYNSEGFGSLASSIHSHDHIEVQWEERVQGRQSVMGVILHCMICDGQLNDDQGAVWQSCMTNLTDKQTAISTVSDFAGSPTSATITIPAINLNGRLQGNPIKGPISMMMCAMLLTLDMTLFPGLDAQPLIPSQLFLAVNKHRGSVPYSSAHYHAHIYNSTYPMGTPSKEIALSSSAPSSEAILPYDGLSYAATRGSGSCSTGNEWKCKPIGDRVGIVLGIFIGCSIILVVFWCFRSRLRSVPALERPRPMLLSELRAQQAQQRIENERNAGTAQARTHEGVATCFIANSASFPVRNDEASPPPAYHEVVNDQERMLATYAMRNQNQTRT